ncbi:glycosyltransferase [Streptomyces sp. O3]
MSSTVPTPAEGTFAAALTDVSDPAAAALTDLPATDALAVDAPAVDVPDPGAVTVIIPTRDEAARVRELLRRITESIPARLPCEVVIVDDSTDDTARIAQEAARTCPFPVTVIHRDHPDSGSGGGSGDGFGGAVVEGLKAATSDWVVVMGADLRHPPSLVPELVATGEERGADLVVATRAPASRTAAWLAKGLFPRALRGVSDPMSGFFAIRRSAVTTDALKPPGRDILLELAVRRRPGTVAEVPYTVQDRYAAESRPTAGECPRFLRRLVELRTASPLARMAAFGLIGVTGFVPNLAALYVLTRAGMHYLPAELLANQLGVAWNFLLIEVLLFRERRRHRHWADRTARFALLANADLVLRLPLIALLVGAWGVAVLPATVSALLITFVLRYAATEALIYLPRRGRRGRRERRAARASHPSAAPATPTAPAAPATPVRGKA